MRIINWVRWMIRTLEDQLSLACSNYSKEYDYDMLARIGSHLRPWFNQMTTSPASGFSMNTDSAMHSVQCSARHLLCDQVLEQTIRRRLNFSHEHPPSPFIHMPQHELYVPLFQEARIVMKASHINRSACSLQLRDAYPLQ